jgi:hypothetical protein
MEKRSRRRIRDLVAHPASQGLDANENRCARISMMARSANAPLEGRIQKRKTNNLQIITSGLQRTAGPYRCANCVLTRCSKGAVLFDQLVGIGNGKVVGRTYKGQERASVWPCACFSAGVGAALPTHDALDHYGRDAREHGLGHRG